MKKTKVLPAFPPDSLIPHLNWIWLIPALGLWTWEQFDHTARGTPLSWLIYGKGIVLLAGAAFLYGIPRLPGYFFLGMFPLSWLAVSHFQWDLCAILEYRYWVWLALFLGMEILVLALPDGKKLLWPLAAFWAALIWLFKFSFLLPLSFATAPAKRFKNAPWARWGGLAAGLALFLSFKGWGYLQTAWLSYYDLLVTSRFYSFFLLGWLGLAAFDPKWKGTFRNALAPLVLLPLGLLLWGGETYVSNYETEIVQWVLIWMAGYGLEGFRKYMMDPSWHGRLVWLAVGLALFGGVI